MFTWAPCWPQPGLSGWVFLLGEAEGPLKLGSSSWTGKSSLDPKHLLTLHSPSLPTGGLSLKELRKAVRWACFSVTLCGSASLGGRAWLSDFNDFLNSFCFLPQGKER